MHQLQLTFFSVFESLGKRHDLKVAGTTFLLWLLQRRHNGLRLCRRQESRRWWWGFRGKSESGSWVSRDPSEVMTYASGSETPH